MKRAITFLAIFLVLFATILPSPAAAGGWHHGGHGCCHHGGGWWWWPGALIGGLALGAVALATAPLWAFTPPPPSPVVVQQAPVVYSQPTYAPPAYSAPAYSQPAYSAPAYSAQATYPVPPANSAPSPYVPPPGSAPSPSYQQADAAMQPPAVRGEVVYEHGRYLLFGDGVRHPWQWVWVPAATTQASQAPPR